MTRLATTDASPHAAARSRVVRSAHGFVKAPACAARLACAALLAGGTLACGADGASRPLARATAEIAGPNGTQLGLVEMRETPHGVLLHVALDGLSPGIHGLHLHERGACEAPDFGSAGGHFAPRGRSHGFFVEEGPHAGDLPNLFVPASGRVEVDLLATGVTLGAGVASLLDRDGTAVVVHEGADDYESQPSGAAGARAACGVVEGQGRSLSARPGDAVAPGGPGATP